jgi:ribosomal protein S18 acetylase RimI-like enzyme
VAVGPATVSYMPSTLPDASLEAARDAAFCTYGALQRFELDGVSLVASFDPLAPPEHGPVGFVGAFASSPGVEAAPRWQTLLAEAETWLRGHGAQWVEGPVHRHTWYPFRAMTAGFDAGPALAGEPPSVPSLPGVLLGARYAATVHSVSTRTDSVSTFVSHGTRPLTLGTVIRPLALSAAARDLAQIHALVCRTFAAPENHRFHPISLAEFALVLGVGAGGASGRGAGGEAPALDPRFIHVAERAGEVVGFVYGTQQEDTVGLKTLCVAPECAGMGIGHALTGALHAAVAEAGVTRMAHMLMLADGPALAISRKGQTRVFREYAVFGKALI